MRADSGKYFFREKSDGLDLYGKPHLAARFLVVCEDFRVILEF